MEDTNSFGEKADILNQRFYLLLENFKNSYILHKENVNYSVNKTRFEEEKDKLQNYFKTILLLDNKIDVKTNELNFFIKNNNKIAITEKMKNEKLKQKFNNISNGDETSGQMYDDTKVLYIQRYIHFIIIVIGILILSLFLYKMFNDESYELDTKLSFSNKVLGIIVICLLVMILSTYSMGINIFEPIEDFFVERGYYNDITLNL
jgi:hypothetical protein